MSKKPFSHLPGVITAYEFNTRRVAEALQCSLPTARYYMQNPGRMRLDDLKALNKAGIPAEELRSCITF